MKPKHCAVTILMLPAQTLKISEKFMLDILLTKMKRVGNFVG